MRLACPACGKTNESETGATCSRCGCDLAKQEKVLQAALGHLAVAAQALRNRQWANALRHAEICWSLRHAGHAARLAFLAAAALGDTPRAIRWRQTAANAEATMPPKES